MSRVCLTVQMKLSSDTIFSSGYSIPGGEDISIKRTEDGMPYLSGSTMKGLLRETTENYLVWTKSDETILHELFGKESCADSDSKRRLVFSDWTVDEQETQLPQEEWVSTRTFTALEEDVVKQGSLRLASCLNSGIVLTGTIICDSEDKKLLKDAIPFLKWVGLLRNRGFGKVETKVTESHSLISKYNIPSASLLRYRIRLKTPLSVSSLTGNTRNENYLDTRNYISGTAVRGMVISQLALTEPEWFEKNKSILLTDGTRFLGAYPVVSETAAVPTPMGFYEDKKQEHFYTVLHHDVEPGHKRAKIGAFCIQKDSILTGISPKMDSFMRIQRGNQEKEQKVFTSRVLCADSDWEGYIQLDDPDLAAYITKAFTNTIHLGASHYAGHGLCEVLALEAIEQPNWGMATYSDADIIPETIYMLLLSPAAMQKDGVTVGLDESKLSDLLGVEKVEITKCSTSVTEINTFNRTWRCYAPSEVMYEKGSLFQLHCTPAPDAGTLKLLEKTGLGIRRAEGFGQVLFLKDFDQIKNYEKPESNAEIHDFPEAKTQRQKRCQRLLETEFPLGSDNYQLSNSQIGSIQEWVQTAIADGGKTEKLDEFFRHNIEDRSPEYAKRFEAIRNEIDNIMKDASIAELLPNDTPTERLMLISEWIDLSRKEEKA